MSRLVNDIVTRLYMGGWYDISSDVRAARGVAIERGSGPEDDTAPPQSCELVLDNDSGNYSERNPLGQYFGALGRNTPLEQQLRLAKDTATAVASNGWGSTDTDASGAWTSYSWAVLGTTSNYAKAAGKATHALAATGDIRHSYLSTFLGRDVEVRFTASVNVSNVTGAALTNGIAIGNVSLRGQGASDTYYMLRMVIQTDETITLDWWLVNSVTAISMTDDPITLSGITHTSSNVYRVAVQSEGRIFRAKVWLDGQAEPYEWAKTYTDTFNDSIEDTVRDTQGWVGVRSSMLTGNTNTNITVSYDDFEVRSPLYFGEVSEWPQARDTSGEDNTVAIEAAGVKRRLGQGRSPALSAPRRAIPNDPECSYYWPMEEGPLAVQGLPVVGTTPLLSLSLGTGSNSAFGSGDLAPWLPDGALIKNEVLGTRQYELSQPSFTAASGWRVEYYRQARGVNDAGDSFYVSDNADGLWLVTIDHGTGDVSIVSPYSTITTTNALLTSGEGAWIKFNVLGSGTVSWGLYVNDEYVLGSAAVGSAQAVRQIVFTGGEQGLAIGQIAIYHGNTGTSAPKPILGHTSEEAAARLDRLCSENSIPLSYFGPSSGTPSMGPQKVKPVLELLEECPEVDGGMLFEPRGTSGLSYKTLDYLNLQSSWCSLSLADGELSPPWAPTNDDRLLRNKITARKPDGGSYTHELETGRLSTLPPEDGGAGIVDDSVDVNVYSDLQLPDQAAWRVHRGTIDEERYPAVVVELARDEIRVANPTLYAKLLDLDVGDQITLTDLDATGIYDEPDQVVIGYRRELTRFTHTLTLCCIPASAFRVAVLNDADVRIDAENAYLDFAVNSSATALKVRNQSARWSTDAGDLPVDIKIGGERMTATAIGSATPTFVAAGTAAHADNASVTPGLPAGLTAGDVLFLVAAIRNTGTGTVNTPSGYSQVASVGGLALLVKEAGASEAAPTVTFSGGAAGATCTAQLAAFRNVSLARANANGQNNASAQNIGFPALTLPNPDATHLVIHVGWKQDDWTSVATLSGSTEIGEPSSTLGSDQGIVWDYRVVQGLHTVTADQFVVTGGASAISIGMVNAQYCNQAFTVTRSVNGVVKSHAYNSEVHVADPYYIGL